MSNLHIQTLILNSLNLQSTNYKLTLEASQHPLHCLKGCAELIVASSFYSDTDTSSLLP